MVRRLLGSAMESAFCQVILQGLGDQVADGLTAPASHLSHALNDLERKFDGENRFGFRKSKGLASAVSLLEVTVSLPRREIELDHQRRDDLFGRVVLLQQIHGHIDTLASFEG
jgi:hypothetical protein